VLHTKKMIYTLRKCVPLFKELLKFNVTKAGAK